MPLDKWKLRGIILKEHNKQPNTKREAALTAYEASGEAEKDRKVIERWRFEDALEAETAINLIL